MEGANTAACVTGRRRGDSECRGPGSNKLSVLKGENKGLSVQGGLAKDGELERWLWIYSV